MLRFWTKIDLFEFFWDRIQKNSCHIWNQHPGICLFEKFPKKTKQKCLKLKVKMISLCFCDLESEKHIVIFKVSSQKFVYLQNFAKTKTKQKCLNFGSKRLLSYRKFRTKNYLFGFFWNRILKNYCHIWKNYCHIWNQQPQNCVFPKFCKKKQKGLNLTPKMLYLSFLELES